MRRGQQRGMVEGGRIEGSLGRCGDDGNWASKEQQSEKRPGHCEGAE